MDFVQMYGVKETVAAFSYTAYISGNRTERRKYEGHERIIAASISESEMNGRADEIRRERHDRWGGGYMGIHEMSYKLDITAKFVVVPVDVIPSVQDQNTS